MSDCNDDSIKMIETKLGKFTSEWSIVKVGDIFPILTSGSTPSRAKPEYFKGEILWVTSGELNYNVIYDTFEKITSEAVRDTNLKLYKPGTFFIAITGLEAAGTRGSCAIIGREATTNQSCMAFQVNEIIDTWFLFQFYKNYGEQVAFAYSQGTKQQSLNGNIVKSIEIPLPPLPEQKKIARILTTVDNLIEKTEALIEKYKAIKQGMMHDLFTRGVDQNGKLRPPYEEAPDLYKESPLGWIPKEWACERVGDHLLRIEQGWSPDCDSEPAGMGEWGVLKTTSVVWAGYNDEANKKLPEELSPRPEYEVKRNDVLMTRGGPNSRVGVVAFVDSTEGKRMMSDKLYRLVSKQSVSPYYLTLALSSELTQTHLSTLKTGLAESQTNISQAIVKRLQILLPTLKEQHIIETLISNITNIIDHHHEELEKMMTIKNGLMQDLLTGNVRVNVDEVEEELTNA